MIRCQVMPECLSILPNRSSVSKALSEEAGEVDLEVVQKLEAVNWALVAKADMTNFPRCD